MRVNSRYINSTRGTYSNFLLSVFYILFTINILQQHEQLAKTAQLIERSTEKPGAILTRVRVYGVARDFSPRDKLRCIFSDGARIASECNHIHQHLRIWAFLSAQILSWTELSIFRYRVGRGCNWPAARRSQCSQAWDHWQEMKESVKRLTDAVERIWAFLTAQILSWTELSIFRHQGGRGPNSHAARPLRHEVAAGRAHADVGVGETSGRSGVAHVGCSTWLWAFLIAQILSWTEPSIFRHRGGRGCNWPAARRSQCSHAWVHWQQMKKSVRWDGAHMGFPDCTYTIWGRCRQSSCWWWSRWNFR